MNVHQPLSLLDMNSHRYQHRHCSVSTSTLDLTVHPEKWNHNSEHVAPQGVEIPLRSPTAYPVPQLTWRDSRFSCQAYKLSPALIIYLNFQLSIKNPVSEHIHTRQMKIKVLISCSKESAGSDGAFLLLWRWTVSGQGSPQSHWKICAWKLCECIFNPTCLSTTSITSQNIGISFRRTMFICSVKFQKLVMLTLQSAESLQAVISSKFSLLRNAASLLSHVYNLPMKQIATCQWS